MGTLAFASSRGLLRGCFQAAVYSHRMTEHDECRCSVFISLPKIGELETMMGRSNAIGLQLFKSKDQKKLLSVIFQQIRVGVWW